MNLVPVIVPKSEQIEIAKLRIKQMKTLNALKRLIESSYNSKPVQAILHKLCIDSCLWVSTKHPQSSFFGKRVWDSNNKSYFMGDFELCIGKLKQ